MTAIELSLDPPGVERCDVVLVIGPEMAGTTGLTCALRGRMPEHAFVESVELNPAHAPIAVVFVVSAIAPLTESDCALLDSAAEHTDLVIGAVSKIDAHRNWRDVLAADRALFAARGPHYARVPWVGAAAAPDLGEPHLDELVGLLRQRLPDPDVTRRNRLRAWETRLQSMIGQHRVDGDDRVARMRALQKSRDDIFSRRRLSKSERTIALRSQLKQARVHLGHLARNRSASTRHELAEYAAQLTRRGVGTFEPHVRTRVAEVVAEVEHGITDHLQDVATALHLPAPPGAASPSAPEISAPPLTSRRQETQLTTILGAGFGLGMALVVVRLFTGLAPGWTVAGLVAGGVVGLVLTLCVVGLRGLLHDRAALDRWVTEVVSVLRSAVEERVASRVLVTETALCSALARQDELESAVVAGRIAEIDAELRALGGHTARAAELSSRRLPLLTALDAVREQLYGSADPENRSAESIHR